MNASQLIKRNALTAIGLLSKDDQEAVNAYILLQRAEEGQSVKFAWWLASLPVAAFVLGVMVLLNGWVNKNIAVIEIEAPFRESLEKDRLVFAEEVAKREALEAEISSLEAENAILSKKCLAMFVCAMKEEATQSPD